MDVIENLNELDMRVLRFLLGNLQKSRIVGLQDIPNVKNILAYLNLAQKSEGTYTVK
jgi:hypothetical protein